MTVGKDAGCEVPLPDDNYASRRHAQLTLGDHGLALMDLDSRNGTFVEIRDPHALRHGDRILIGTTVFEYQEGAVDDVASPSLDRPDTTSLTAS